MAQQQKRKKRIDRNHIVYQITCDTTGERYIGITVAQGRAFKRSVHVRWIKHVHRALTEQADLPLAEAIREHGREAFSHEILNVVRGKAAAHADELKRIHKIQPELNKLGTID